MEERHSRVKPGARAPGRQKEGRPEGGRSLGRKGLGGSHYGSGGFTRDGGNTLQGRGTPELYRQRACRRSQHQEQRDHKGLPRRHHSVPFHSPGRTVVRPVVPRRRMARFATASCDRRHRSGIFLNGKFRRRGAAQTGPRCLARIFHEGAGARNAGGCPSTDGAGFHEDPMCPVPVMKYPG